MDTRGFARRKVTAALLSLIAAAAIVGALTIGVFATPRASSDAGPTFGATQSHDDTFVAIKWHSHPNKK